MEFACQSLPRGTLKGEKTAKDEKREGIDEAGEMKETDRMEKSEGGMKEER